MCAFLLLISSILPRNAASVISDPYYQTACLWLSVRGQTWANKNKKSPRFAPLQSLQRRKPCRLLVCLIITLLRFPLNNSEYHKIFDRVWLNITGLGVSLVIRTQLRLSTLRYGYFEHRFPHFSVGTRPQVFFMSWSRLTSLLVIVTLSWVTWTELLFSRRL